MPDSSILLVDQDLVAGQVLTDVLNAVGYKVTFITDPGTALARVPDHQLVIIDVVAGGRSAADICREIRATPALAAIPVVCISQTDDVADRIRFLEVGADDVLAKPFDARELEARVEALLLRFQRSRDLTPVEVADKPLRVSHRLVTVFSPKGGVGTTTIAVNLAVAVAARRPERTLLIDLDRQFGQVATHLNLPIRQTMADLVRDTGAIREPELLRTYATHSQGLHVLVAPGSPELGETINAEHVDILMQTAVTAYDAVIVDAGSHLDDPSLTALDRADGVVFTVYPEIPALRALHSLLEVLGEIGHVAEKATLVLNNVFAREILKMRDIESALGTKIAAELTYDPFAYLKAVNEGVPVVRGAPRSIPAEELVKLAAIAFGEEYGSQGAGQEKRSGLFGGRKKRS